ncbi:TPA: hypothetical protein MNK97_005856 [Klebsiella pneumoniae]|nr:hypothetical protein [Klebsiella pneumoniae]
MRPPVPLEIPAQLVELATLYAPSRDPLQAVSHILQDYPNVIGDLRKLRSRVLQLDEEGALLDERLEALKQACQAILDLCPLPTDYSKMSVQRPYRGHYVRARGVLAELRGIFSRLARQV